MKLGAFIGLLAVVLAILAALASLVIVLCSQLPTYNLVPLQLR